MREEGGYRGPGGGRREGGYVGYPVVLGAVER